MAERIPIPTESDKCNWADGGTYPSTDPGDPARLAGFKPKDYPVAGAGAIVPAEDHNFLWRLGMEMISWLRDLITRQWADVSEGIAATDDMDIFRVIPGIVATARGTLIFFSAGTGTGSTNATQPCTDGEQIYYIGGATASYIVAASPIDGAEIWEENDLSVGLSAICTDGKYVYVQTVDSGVVGLYVMRRDDGTQEDNAGSEYSCKRLAANGSYCVGIAPSGGLGEVVVYSDVQGTIAEDGTYNTGSALLRAVAIDHDQCYVGGGRNTEDVWCVALDDTSTAVWSTALPTSAAPEVYGIAADGDRVYVATDRQALTAGGNANLHCLDRINGAVLWSIDVSDATAGTFDLTSCCVDHRYIYVTDDDDDLHVITKSDNPTQVLIDASHGDVCCDGVSVIGNSDTTVTTQFKRTWMADGQTTFQARAYSDVERRPIPGVLAVPID